MRVRALILAHWDHRSDTAPAQVATHRGVAVAVVAHEPPGFGPGAATLTSGPHQAHGAKDRLDELRLVSLPRTHRRGQGDAVAVDRQVQLGAEASTRAPQGMVLRLTRYVFPPPRRPLRGWPG